MKIFTRLFILAFVFQYTTGCVSTERIKGFSAVSLESLEASSTIDYTFTKNCVDRALYNNKISLEQRDANGTPVLALKMPEECTQSNASDAAKTAIINVLFGYFDALHRLSDNGTPYSVTGVTDQLKPGNYTGLKIDDATVASVNNLSTILLSAVAGAYRNKKIKQFIADADKNISSLIDKLDGYYELLAVSATNNSTNIVNFYTPFKSEQSPYLKSAAEREMLEKLNKNEQAAIQINEYRQLLQTIKTSHNEVVAKAGTASFKELTSFIGSKSSDINSLYNEFKHKSKAD